MTADNTRHNFYTLLGLNPDEPWDQTKFERVLREYQAELQRASEKLNSPLTAQGILRDLRLIPEIRRVMEDPVLRDAEAAAATAELAAKKQSRIEEFEKILELAQAKGYIGWDEVVGLFNTFKDVLSQQKIHNRITVPIHVGDPDDWPPYASSPHLTSERLIPFRITEEPLTAQNLTTIISSLTELSTKYWLIAKGRFADLVEYTQTHNGRFAQEANVVVTKITYNSPMNMEWKVDLSASNVAEALVTTVEGIVQVRKRLEKAELENQEKAQEIRHAEQQADHEQQMALLEREKQQLEIEQQRLKVLETRLEVQKKGIEYALEIAGKVVDLLHPGADLATRAMEIQALLPNLVQLQNGKGLELALPPSQKSTADSLSEDDPLGGYGRVL